MIFIIWSVGAVSQHSIRLFLSENLDYFLASLSDAVIFNRKDRQNRISCSIFFRNGIHKSRENILLIISVYNLFVILSILSSIFAVLLVCYTILEIISGFVC